MIAGAKRKANTFSIKTNVLAEFGDKFRDQFEAVSGFANGVKEVE